MTDYEMMFVMKPDVEKDDISSFLDKIKDIIEKGSGVVLHHEDMGKRELATELNKYKEAYYFYLDFSADKSILDSINGLIKINEGVLTTLLVKLDSIKVTPKA